MAIEEQAAKRWSVIDDAEAQVQQRSDEREDREDRRGDRSWTDEERLMATVNEIHCRLWRVEQRIDVLFSIALATVKIAKRIALLALLAVVVYLVGVALG